MFTFGSLTAEKSKYQDTQAIAAEVRTIMLDKGEETNAMQTLLSRCSCVRAMLDWHASRVRCARLS